MGAPGRQILAGTSCQCPSFQLAAGGYGRKRARGRNRNVTGARRGRKKPGRPRGVSRPGGLGAMSALDRLKARQRESQATRRPTQLPRDHAARSHELNDAYMERFEEGFRALSMAAGASTSGGVGTSRRGPRGSAGEPQIAGPHAPTAGAPAPALGHLRPARPAARGPSFRNNAPASSGGLASRSSSSRSLSAAGPVTSPADGATGELAEARNAQIRRMASVPLSQGWASGPEDTAGTCVQLSDRPVLCGDADWGQNECVLGCSDHALYVLDIAKGRQKRTLHSKAHGHKEWVTCVTYLPDGRIVSGAMDSKLCLWNATGVACRDLTGHAGPVSCVQRAGAGGWVASCGYDKTVRLWDCSSRNSTAACAQTLTGHRAPVLCMDVDAPGSRVVSGDRGGALMLWDTVTGSASLRWDALHSGHTTAAAMVRGDGEGNVAISGGQDGAVCMVDARVWQDPVCVRGVHVTDKGHGAVGAIKQGAGGVGGYVVTAGADGTVRVLDLRESLGEVVRVLLTDFPYDLCVVGGHALVGCGDGSLHVVEVGAGKRLYALGANRAAVRVAMASGGQLVAAGDDGTAMLYRFP